MNMRGEKQPESELTGADRECVKDMILFEKEEDALVRKFLDSAEQYLSSQSTEEQKEEAMKAALDDVDYFLLQAASRVDDYEKLLARKIDLMTFLDDVRLEAHKRGVRVDSESWECFLDAMSHRTESALMEYKVAAMYHRTSVESSPVRPSLDHAKKFLMDIAESVLKEPRAKYADPEIDISWKGHAYYWLSDLLQAAGKDKIWETMSEDEILGTWADFVWKHDSDLETREKLAQSDLRKQYLDARKELDENVSDDLVVTKIAPDAIGVFDSFGRLKSVSTDQDKSLHVLSEEKLFAEDSRMTDREKLRKERAVRDVASVMDLRVREMLEKDFGFKLSELTLREQVWFASTLIEISVKKTKRLQKFTETFGEEGARALLSAEFGDKFRDYVLAIGEKTDARTAEKIFHAFGKIASAAQTEAGVLLEEFFAEGKGEPVDAAKIEMELLTRAKKLIEDFAKEAMKAKATGGKPNSTALLKKLEQANADTVLFASIFKAAFKGRKGVEFENLRGVEFGERMPSDFTDDEREEMLEVFDENWGDQNKLAAETFRGDLKRGFDPENKSTKFYITKKDGVIIGFIRFDKRDDLERGAYYAGSLNVRSEYRGSAIGDAIMEKTLAREAGEHTLYAHVVADAVVGTRYVENGFVITGVKWIKRGGERVAELAIRWDNSKNEMYRARTEGVASKESLEGINGVNVQSFDCSKNKDSFLKAIEEASLNGEVVSRYWVDSKNKNLRHLAIERDVLSEELSDAA